MTPTACSNSFSALTDSSTNEHDDEETVLQQLSTFASVVNVGPKVSQKQRKSGLNKAKITRIAAAIRKGEIQLPDLELDNNEEWVAVWALVDSGAGASTANLQKHFPGAKLRKYRKGETPMIMSTASGQSMKTNGTFVVQGQTTEGYKTSTRFVDADVDMPILAVSDIASSGERGCDVKFDEKGGSIIDNATQTSARFHKERGVYFLRIFVRASTVRAEPPTFARPGVA